MKTRYSIALLLAAGSALAMEPSAFGKEPAAPLRTEICLNGTWELKVDGVSEPVDIRVPGSFAGQDKLWGGDYWDVWGYPKQWFTKAAVYSRTLTIPPDLKGQRVLIRFGGVRHVVRVEVNGQEAGSWSDSYVPFAFDITDQVHAGNNELRVHIASDQTCGLFEDVNTKRRGIYRDVFLQFVPEVRVTPDLYVQTSVSKQELTCEVPVRNDSKKAQQVSLRFKVTDAEGKVVKSWAAGQQVSVAPGAVQTVAVTESWNNPHLWSIDDPNLYHLNTVVLNAKGTVLDRHRLRFGFREISWKNHQLFLNGRELFLRGHGGHPMGELQGGKEYSEAWIRQLKEQGVELMRMHDLPRHAEMYDAADEMGFLFISEAAHHFRLPPKELALAHMERMVKWLRNRPSVAMWSVANELHWRDFEEPVYLIELCNKLDPSRPAFNSDFSQYSLHGDLISHHYSPDNMWSDWETYGPDKPMIWDEIGGVWQRDRPLKTGPAGVEISSQDVATGIWRDGWEQLRNDIETFADGREINGRFYRVNAYCPWEFSYVFYRFQPFNNFQRVYPEYDQTEGEKGIQPAFINPCATTLNIWDPTLPEFQANPGLYCFNEYLQRVRFPDDPKERTFFSRESIERSGRLFFEDHRPADRVEFRVETPEGEVLTSVERTVALSAGEYVPDFKSEWKMPAMESVMPVRLVRQFSYEGETGYRKVDEAKVFPAFKPVDLSSRNVAVVGDALQDIFGGAGVPVSKARMIVADSFNPAWEAFVAKGVRVLVQSPGSKMEGKSLTHLNLTPAGKRRNFAGSIAQNELSDGTMLSFGTPGKETSIVTDRSFMMDSPMPGAWVALDFAGTLNFSKAGMVNLSYGLWKHPGTEGYDKQWEDAGGAPFYRKTARIMICDAAGQWFVCAEKEALAIERKDPKGFKGMLKFDCLDLSWQPVRLESGAVVETREDLLPDLSRVSAVGVMLGESNPASQLQINGVELRGGSGPAVMVQPGGAAHVLLSGLGQEDFSFWRGESSSRSLPLPEKRNVRRILFGDTDGSGSALQETFIGRGVVLESALNIGTLQEPAAGFLLNRMVDYLDAYEPAETAHSISVVGEGHLADWLASLGADVCSDLSAADIAAVNARDAQSLLQAKTGLINHLEKGGTVLFSEVTPETIDIIRQITGKPLRLTEPFFEQHFKCIKAPVSWARIGSPHQWVDYYDGVLAPYPFEPNVNPLLAGIANLDLDWNMTPMFQNGIELEGMNPVSASAGYQVLISNWHIGSEPCKNIFGEQLNGVRDLRQNSWFVNRDSVVMELTAQGGRVLVSQLNLAAGGDKAKRVMQTLLTNLGVSFDGAMPAPAADVYDQAIRKDQLARFAVYDQQIDPVQRQFYGIPNPMPDYLAETRIQRSSADAELPVLGFFGDPLTLGLAKPLAKALEGTVRMDRPVRLPTSDKAVDQLRVLIGDKQYDRVVFALGESDLDAARISIADFRRNLEESWTVLAEHSQKIYWVPIPSAYGKDQERAARAKAFNQVAAQFFEEKDVYTVPFLYAAPENLPVGYFSGRDERFQPAEAKALAALLADAVISFGAQ